ncbi:MAG TPA: D-glucuronyl C5-epimerase family protein [Solirubrobacteraceae bacterium]|nr:D-glucuronyl C5-epimerase family protein [Solirubrobacteraceae bacterium]
MSADPVTLHRLVRLRPLVLALFALLLAAPAAAAQSTDPVQDTIDALEASGQADPVVADAWSRDWRDARIARRRLGGTAGAQLAGVVRNTETLAKREMLALRIKPAMLVVQRNVEWYWRDRQAAPANGTRRAFPGSDVVLQHYAGHGWQLQPLANLGTLNALSRRRRITERTRAWADDVLDLAVRRDGAIAFEYMFPFSGGGPGWASAMPQAIALETYARLGRRAEARQMLELFRLDPPAGVRFITGPGQAHFLMYPQAPRLLIGNGFAQALLSLHAYLALEPGDPAVREAYDMALNEARAGMSLYDTGAWSLYYHEPGSARGAESDLHYHRLFRELLEKLCDRIGGEPFCSMADSFAVYETEPVRFGTPRIVASRRRIEGRVFVSKRSSVRATLWRDDVPVRAATGAAKRGTFRVRFARPREAGEYRIVFEATALTGQRSTTEVLRELGRRPSAAR